MNLAQRFLAMSVVEESTEVMNTIEVCDIPKAAESLQNEKRSIVFLCKRGEV